MSETLEKKFTQKDIDSAMYWVESAESLVNGTHEWNALWATSIIENLRPYVSKGNVAEMEHRVLKNVYYEKTGMEYQQPERKTPPIEQRNPLEEFDQWI